MSVAVRKHDQPELIGGRYEIRARLGAGGMGAVYRAIDRASGNEVALKRILEEPGRKSSRAVVRFQNEFHTIARLQHPHIVEVHDYGVDESGPYYTMEILDGEDLRDMERPPIREACRILRDVAVALSFLHSRHLLHRDLGPRNVRLTASGRAKLIDFGLLGTFGPSPDIAGTPPLIAPEMVRGLPMDQRADLYQLGGLAYWLVGGQYAYPAKAIQDLEGHWRIQPPALSTLAEDVPESLEELITSLICLDPLGRPRSAAEVADRLTAIGQLEAPEVDLAGGYVASAALIGREREMESIRRSIKQTATGEGGLLVIRAPSGVGKSRLLRESLFEAQLAGTMVVQASSDSANQGPYGLFRALARELLGRAKEDTIQAARPDAVALASVIPELREPLAAELAEAPDEGITDPAEERLRAQSAINKWILRVATHQPMTVLVDDVQRCDEASLAVLLGLSYSNQAYPLLLLLSLRSDEAPRYPELLRALDGAGSVIELRGLGLSETESFVSALFGNVPRVSPFARWMHQVTKGSPLHLSELAQYAVAKGIVSYHDGMWVLPTQNVEIELPEGLRGAMDARIGLLEEHSRALAECLAVHGGQLNLELAIELAEESDANRIFDHIDELLEQQVLVGSPNDFRFRHDGLREALLRGLSEERAQSLHLRVAKVLERDDAEEEERVLEMGWHYYRGGDKRRGTALLEEAGRQLFNAQAMRDALEPIETAILAYRERGDRSHAYYELLYMIVMAGAISDQRVAKRYLEETLDVYQKKAGISLARKVGKLLGRHVGLAIGVLSSVLAWVVAPRKARGDSPLYMLTRFLLMTAHAAYIHYAANDVEGLRKTLERVGPINAFKGKAPHGAYESQMGMLDLMQGRLDEAARKFRYGVHVVQTDKLTPTTDFEKRYIEAAGRGFVVVATVMELDKGIDEELERIRELDLRYFAFAARAGVALRLRLRGEEEQARQVAQELEVIGMQLGAGWHLEALLLSCSSYAYALSRDVLGLKRCAEELHRLNEAGLFFHAQLSLVRGEYHRERGELDLAEENLDDALSKICDEEVTIRQWVWSAKAELYLAQGRLAEALECVRRVVGTEEEPAKALLLPRIRSIRSWALILAARGETEEARKKLGELEQEIKKLANPVLSCLYHEACARIALMEQRPSAFDEHVIELAHAVNPTRNPALIAVSERLRNMQRSLEEELLAREALAVAGDSAATAVDPDSVATAVDGATDLTAPTVGPSSPSERMASNLLAGCYGIQARIDKALEILVMASSGKAGFLFLIRDGEAVLASPEHGSPTPAVQRAIDSLVRGEDEAVSHSQALEEEGWHLMLLRASIGSYERTVGAVAILSGAIRYRAPDARIGQQLARELYQAGDATAIQSQVPFEADAVTEV